MLYVTAGSLANITGESYTNSSNGFHQLVGGSKQIHFLVMFALFSLKIPNLTIALFSVRLPTIEQQEPESMISLGTSLASSEVLYVKSGGPPNEGDEEPFYTLVIPSVQTLFNAVTDQYKWC